MDTRHCDNCALRLFNNKGYNLIGEGNYFYGNGIVIPNVDYIAYKKQNIDFSDQLQIISDCVHSFKGENVIDSFYITPFIKCKENKQCLVNPNIINNCINYLNTEIVSYNLQRILLLGSSGRRLFNINIEDYFDIILVLNKRAYFLNYAPGIKYFDDKKYDVFCLNLIHYIDACRSRDFSNYKVIYIQ